MALAQTFLELYYKDGDKFLNHIATGDKTWVSFAVPIYQNMVSLAVSSHLEMSK
jgi:hypothetical protein